MHTITPNSKLPFPIGQRMVARRVLKFFLRIPAFSGVMKQLEIHVNSRALEEREAVGVGASLFAAFNQALRNDLSLAAKVTQKNPRFDEDWSTHVVPSDFVKLELGNKTVHIRFKKDEESTVVVEEKGG